MYDARGSRRARLADGPVKIFREEVLSFRPVAEFLYADTRALVRFPADNGPRDVLVAEVGQGAEQPFEIVTAGEQVRSNEPL